MNGNVKAGSGDEWFDIVNDRDEVIGQERRAVVHVTGLWHRAVHILVFNATGQVFLQKRSMSKDMSPGLWDSSCSGHVDAGEAYDQAAQRELREELGVKLDHPPERWLRIAACAQTGWEFCWVYRLNHNGPFVLHPEEIEQGEWHTPTEVTRLLAECPEYYCPAFTLIWSRVSPSLAVGTGPA
jgi:isopentenyl-diphosphate delta-isomerase type 1